MNFIKRLFGGVKETSRTSQLQKQIPGESTHVDAFGGCGHPGPRVNLKIRVFGKEVIFKQSPLCRTCTEARIVECSTHCAGCDHPILPGQRVAQAWVGAAHSYTHMSDKCGNPHFYAGAWGAGVLIGLAELHPEVFGEDFLQELLPSKS